jgi:site-specific recombinase XerD
MTPSNKGLKLPAEPLTEDEMRRLIRACSNRAPTGIRNRALLVVLYRGGLRLNEALQLFPKDLAGEHCTLRVLHGKGDRARLVGLDDGAWAILQRWMDRRASLGINRHRRVFCTLAGDPLQPSYVRALLPRLARRGKIDKRVHAHGLRHTHAFELANENRPLHLIQAQLGHASLAVTDRYIKHLAPLQLVETMRSRKWKL